MKTDRVVDLTKKISERSSEKDAIKKAVETEQRAMTPEEKKKVGELLTEIRSLSEELALEQEEIAVEDLVNQSRVPPTRPTIETEDEMQRRYPGIPKKELRFSHMGEFVRDVIHAHPSRSGRFSEKLQESVRAATGMGETNPTDGGFLVQADMSSRLIEPLFGPTGDAVLSRLNTTNVSGNGLTFNAINETSRATTNWGGIAMYWLGEGSEKTASTASLRKVELKLKKIAGLLYLTDELMEDAPAFASRLENGFRIALRSSLVRAVISGTGSGQPLGLLNSSAKIAIAAETGQSAATIVTENILNMRERLTPGAISPVWLYNPTCYKQLFKLQVGLGTAGVLISGQTIQSAGMQSMLGIPMVECPWCSVLGTAGDLILTDLGQYEFIQKGGPSVAYSIHVKFIYDETAMRIVYRCDGQPSVVSSTTLEDGSTTASPIITLATRS
jgi:HK97 family phage major capsid protein